MLSESSATLSAVSVSRMDRISSPVLPCASRESITDLDIMKKESVMNCVLSKGAPSSLILAVVLVPGACLVYTHATGVCVT